MRFYDKHCTGDITHACKGCLTGPGVWKIVFVSFNKNACIAFFSKAVQAKPSQPVIFTAALVLIFYHQLTNRFPRFQLLMCSF